MKQGKVACRSESAAGTKDAIETVLVVTDLHLAAEKGGAANRAALMLFKVLGQVSGEEELTINCGGVKDKVKGVIGGLAHARLNDGRRRRHFHDGYVQNRNASHDKETGECEKLCEWLTEHPFESNLGAGFEDTWMAVKAERDAEPLGLHRRLRDDKTPDLNKLNSRI